MSEVVRFGVSLESDLLKRFDSVIQSKNYSNRSEAIRDLIRESLIQQEWQQDQEVAGAVTLIYDHHKRELTEKLIEIQHRFTDFIMASQHIHLDHHNCLEIIAVKGSPKKVQEIADALRAIKGVKHGTLSMSTTGEKM